jgi:hypothetical protein
MSSRVIGNPKCNVILIDGLFTYVSFNSVNYIIDCLILFDTVNFHTKNFDCCSTAIFVKGGWVSHG